MPLSDADFVAVQENIASVVEALAGLHLSFTVDSDLSRGGLAMFDRMFPATAPGAGGGNFCVHVVDSDDRLVGYQAHGVRRVAALSQSVRDGSLWCGAGFAANPAWAEGAFHALPAELSGTLVFAGQMAVAPNLRRRGLGVWLSYLGRLLCARNFDPDFYVALSGAPAGGAAEAVNAHGYAHLEPLLRGYFPPTGRVEDIQIAYMTRAEMLGRDDVAGALRRLPPMPRLAAI